MAIFAVAILSTSFASPNLTSPIKLDFKTVLKKAPGAETFSFNENYEIVGGMYNPCNGELIEYTGSIHYSYHGVINGKKSQFKSHFNTQGVSGVGQATGTKYQLIEVINSLSSYSVDGCTVTATYDQKFKIVSAGSDDNFTATTRVKYTYNYCTGELDIQREQFEVECQ